MENRHDGKRMSACAKLMSFNVLNGWGRNFSVYKTMLTRSVKAAELIQRELPDILCLQEFDYYYRYDSEFISMLTDTYAEADTRDETPAQSWNPIFYKRSEFRLIESGGYDFVENGFIPVKTGNGDKETYPPHSTNCGKYTYPEESEEWKAGYDKSRFRSLSYAVLENGDGSRITVANTHYSLRSWCHGDEVEFVLDRLAEVKKKHPYPLLICGDFNSTTQWGAGKRMLENGLLDTYDLAAEKDDRPSCHPSSGKGTGEPDEMSQGSYKTHAIDHVYTDSPMEVSTYRILAEDALLSVSDHCPTMIQFKMEE
ncbi:MAG: endonuclease/exonuclease/phosphatase family protein [Clostridia bacterium]|nr:endonuclease/exonuclease/phosphatase family protein [Clostridia bacterium]